MSAAQEQKDLFREYFKATHAPGTLDARTKQLIHVTLVLAMRCEP